MNFYKLLLFLTLPSLSLFAKEGIIEKVTKEFHKEIMVKPNATVQVENQFGDIIITSWDQNKVVIDVLITVEGNNVKKINQKLNSIDIRFDLDSDLVQAITEINDKWSFSWINTSKVKFKIDYTIKMPATNAINLKNDYGTIVLNYLEGKARLSCDYGKMIIGELFATDNELSFDYTSNSSIEYIAGGEINADYSGFEITEAGIIDLTADYTSSFFEMIDSLHYSNDYGKLKIDKARSVNGKGDYLTFTLEEISEFLDLKNEFGSIRVAYVAPLTKNISINGEYTGIQLGIDSEWPFVFEFDLEFSSIKSKCDFEFEKQIIENTEKYYKGHHKNPESNNTLMIVSEFGNLKLYPTSKH